MNRRRAFVMAVFAALSAALCSLAAPAHAVTVPTGFSDQVIVSNLDEPRAFTFLPDGRVLIVEQRTARVRLVVNGHVAAQDPIAVISDVYSVGYERGLQSVAVDPGWPARPYLYFFHNANGGVNKLVRYTASGALSDPNAETMTLSNRVELIGDVRDNDPNHNAGCLKFAPDGMLFLSLGEDEVWCDAQDSTSFRGCILRLDVSGLPANPAGAVTRAQLTPASGNPLVTTNANAKLVWAYGMRNPWSFDVDRYTGTIYTADVGEADYEELNEIRPGGNYGWPYREGPLVLPRANCPEPGGAGNAANGYLPPLAYFGRDAALHSAFCGGLYRPVGGAGFTWPVDHRGSLFWGDYYDGWLQRMVRNASNQWVVAPAVPGQPSASWWGSGFTSFVDSRVNADGDLVWLRQYNDNYDGVSGELHRLRWTGSTAGAPAAPAHTVALAAAPNPFRGGTQLSFTLASAARVRLAVYDLAGRRVRALVDADAAAGDARASWDGANDDGSDAAPGLYLARLELDGRPAGTTRLFRVR